MKVTAAKRRAFDTLLPKDREGGAQRDLALAERIYDLFRSGHTASEIGAAVGRSADSVCRFAKAWWGISISRSETEVFYVVTLSKVQREALTRVAADYGTTPAECLEDFMEFALDNDAAIARGILEDARLKRLLDHADDGLVVDPTAALS